MPTPITLALSDDGSINWLDFVPGFVTDYSIAIADTLTLTDSLKQGYGFRLTDTVNFWSDFVPSQFVIQLALSDTLNFWTTVIATGYGLRVSDNGNFWLDLFQYDGVPGLALDLSDAVTTWFESLNLGYALAVSDQLVASDTLVIEYSLSVSDDANTWLDDFGSALQFIVMFTLTVSDDLNLWQDAMIDIPGGVFRSHAARIHGLSVTNREI